MSGTDAGHRQDEQAHDAEPLAECALEAVPVRSRRHRRHLGDERGDERDREDAVGQLVPHPRVAQRRGTVAERGGGEVVPEGHADDVDADVAEDRQHLSAHLAQGRVLEVDPHAEPEADPQQRGDLDHEERDHAERRPHAERHERDVRPGVLERQVHAEQDDDHDDVVEQRRDRGGEELPIRVEHARRDGAPAVEDDLHREEAEQVHGQARLVGRHAEGLRAHERIRPQRPDERDEPQQDERQAEQGVGEGVCLLLAVPLEPLHEDRDEHRGEHAAGEQFVHHVRDVVRDVEGRCHGDRAGRCERDTEGHSHRPRADEAAVEKDISAVDRAMEGVVRSSRFSMTVRLSASLRLLGAC
jgi:hypothetical protein